jgi:hypothetical protein
MEKADIKTNIVRILNNHKQSSLDGLNMLIKADTEEIVSCISEMIFDGKLREVSIDIGYSRVTVYKLKQPKQLKIKF